MQKIKFFKTHILLLEEKSKSVLQIAQMFERAKAEYSDIVKLIATEDLGISEKEVGLWRVSKDRLSLEKCKKGEEKNEKKKA